MAKKNNRHQAPVVDMNDWLRNRRPLVTITRQRADGALSRAMGFVYEILPSGRVVVCTCRHNFIEVNDLKAFTLLGGFNRNEQYRPLHSNPVYAPDDRDISFIVAARTTMAQRLRLLDSRAFDKWNATEEVILYNCRNAIAESEGTQLFAMRQHIRLLPDLSLRAWVDIHNEMTHLLSETDVDEFPGLRTRGYQEHGYICMITRPGFSGSPIWDERLRLIGMNIRGSEGGDESDCAVYVYSGDIQRAYTQLRQELLAIDHGC